jgi:hypothetical protein
VISTAHSDPVTINAFGATTIPLSRPAPSFSTGIVAAAEQVRPLFHAPAASRRAHRRHAVVFYASILLHLN